jgi:hypothetical protein
VCVVGSVPQASTAGGRSHDKQAALETTSVKVGVVAVAMRAVGGCCSVWPLLLGLSVVCSWSLQAAATELLLPHWLWASEALMFGRSSLEALHALCGSNLKA